MVDLSTKLISEHTAVLLNFSILLFTLEKNECGTWWTVVIKKHSGHKFVVVFPAVGRRPDHLRRLVVQPLTLLSPVETPEEESVHAHRREDVGLLARVAERVDLPPHPRNSALAEGVLQLLETQ